MAAAARQAAAWTFASNPDRFIHPQLPARRIPHRSSRVSAPVSPVMQALLMACRSLTPGARMLARSQAMVQLGTLTRPDYRLELTRSRPEWMMGVEEPPTLRHLLKKSLCPHPRKPARSANARLANR